MYNNYNEEFSSKLKVKNSKSFGIRKDFTILLVMTFIFASKILLVLGAYTIFLMFTLIISIITFFLMLIFASIYRLLKKIYYADTQKILIPISIDIVDILSASSINTIDRNNNSSMFNIPVKTQMMWEKLKSRNFSKLSIIFALIFLAYLLLFYAIISSIFFIDSIINTVMTSTALQYKLF